MGDPRKRPVSIRLWRMREEVAMTIGVHWMKTPSELAIRLLEYPAFSIYASFLFWGIDITFWKKV